MLEKIQIIKQRFDEVSDLIIQPDIISDHKRYIQINKEYKDLKKILERAVQTQTHVLQQISITKTCIVWFVCVF